jgi:transcription initiation factor TFIIIB Brf1 subunit/transcription initiation factor TFIIB
VLHNILSDKRVKEAVITPRGVRIVRQASEGDRGAHLILRQVRFPVDRIAPELVLQAVSEADRICDALALPASQPRKRLA